MVVPEIGAEVAIERTVTVTPANQAAQDSSAAAFGKVRKCGDVFAFIGPDRDISAQRRLPATSQYDRLGFEAAECGHFGRTLDLGAVHALVTLEQCGAVIVAEA